MLANVKEFRVFGAQLPQSLARPGRSGAGGRQFELGPQGM
jgi:hypothetical protein